MDKGKDEERAVKLAKEAVAALSDGQNEVHPITYQKLLVQALIDRVAWLKSVKRSHLIGA